MLAVTVNVSAGYITEPIANQSEGALVTSRKLGRLRSHSNEGTTLELTMAIPHVAKILSNQQS